jgi:hypothetical protein
MPIGIARRAEPSPGRQFDVLVLGLGALAIVAGLVAFIASSVWLVDRRSARPRRRSSRHLPLPAGNAAPRAVGLRYAFASGRDAAPSRTAVAAIAAAIAGVVAVVAFGTSLGHLVDTPALYGWTFDAVGIATDHVDAVRGDGGVAGVAEIRAQFIVQVAGDPVNGYAIRPIEGDVAAPIVRGREPRTVDEIALGSDTMAHAGVGIGDRVHVSGQDSQGTMRVVGQAVFPTDEDAYPLADGALVSFDAADKLGTTDDSLGTLAITFRPGDEAQATRRLSKLTDDGLSRPRPPAEIEKLEQVRRLPELLAGFMVLLGVVAIAHAMIVSVRRNRRELGVLRALGFRGRDVGVTVAWQAVALAVVGAVVGLPAGILVGRFVWRAVADSIGVRAVPALPALALVVVVPAAVLVAVLTALLPARRAARMHPTELLRSE